MFDPNSLKTLRMYGSSGWEEGLHELVDPAVLPEALGGSCKTSWCSDVSYYPDFHCPGQGAAEERPLAATEDNSA